jgi:hypothetical protein
MNNEGCKTKVTNLIRRKLIRIIAYVSNTKWKQVLNENSYLHRVMYPTKLCFII